jgi:hypothetical protein
MQRGKARSGSRLNLRRLRTDGIPSSGLVSSRAASGAIVPSQLQVGAELLPSFVENPPPSFCS